MLSRAGVKGNRKLILVLIQERTLLLVSGRIESSAFSLSLSSCSFSLAFSLVLLPSYFLSLLQVLAFLPPFLPWDVTRSSGKCTQNKSAHSAVTVRICIIVRSRKNLHTCKAGSRSPLVKYARDSHIGFHSTSQTRSCALRMPRYVTFTDKNSHRKITMIHTQTTYINRIALRAGKKGTRPTEVGALAPVFEKSATEL